MGIDLLGLVVGIAQAPVDTIGKLLNATFESDEEKLTRAALLERIKAKIPDAQAQINTQEARSTSLFIAGWRPFIGWICGFNLIYVIFLRDWICVYLSARYSGYVPVFNQGPEVGIELVVAILGLGGLRSWEKIKSVDKQ